MPAPKSNALTDAKVRGKLKPGRHIDGRGLALLVTATGGRSWQLRYKLNGAEGTFTIGRFPDVGLAEARRHAEEARAQIAEGRHPKAAKLEKLAAEKAAEVHTLDAVMRKWLARKKPQIAGGSYRTYKHALERVAAVLGERPVKGLGTAEIRDVLDEIKAHSTRARAFMVVNESLDDAVERELIDVNPLRLRPLSLPKKPKTKNRPALLTPEGMGEFMVRLDAYPPGRSEGAVKAALQMLALLPARPSEICGMRWDDVDLDAGAWVFHVAKIDELHTLHIPSQGLEILKAWKPKCGGSPWVFPSQAPERKGLCIARTSLRDGIVDTLQYPAGTLSAHGFRASLRTMGRKHLKIMPTVLELMLSHTPPKIGNGGLGRAYDRDDWLDERREAAQAWANFLDAEKAAAVARGYTWAPIIRKVGRPRKQVV